MLSAWWNFEGVIHWKFVPNGRAVNADLYSQQLERVQEILRRWYSAVEVDLTEFFASENRDWYPRRIINLAERWLIMIESDGLYFGD